MSFIEQEIRKEVWSCHGDNSPRLDGFNLRFMKECWEVVKEDIVDFFNEFHTRTALPKAIVVSIVTLIVKIEHPLNATYFHVNYLVNYNFSISIIRTNHF